MAVEGISFLHTITIGEVSDPQDPGGNILEVSTQADGDFDKTNLVTDISRQVWRSTDTNEQFIKVKSEAPTQPDTVALIGTNLTADAVVILEANSVDDFDNPPFCVEMLIVNAHTTHAVFLNDFGNEYEYFRFRILDPDNPCGYIEVGRVAGGQAFTYTGGKEGLQNAFTIGYTDTSKSMTNEGYSRPSNTNILFRTLQGMLSKMETRDDKDNTNFLGLIEMIENVKTNRPFLTILDRNNPRIFTAWTEFSNLPNLAYDINELATADLKLQEVF